MADATYYFNARHATEVWTDPDQAVDNNLETFASTTVNNEVQRLITNTCPGTNLGTITKVEIRAYAKGDGNDELYIRPEFTGGAGNNHITVPVVAPGGWGAYQDITNDPNAPDWSLWSHIQDLECDIELDDTGKGNTMYCAKVEIRVTYWVRPVSDIDVGAEPIPRPSVAFDGLTIVDKNNPANASGTLHTIKVYAQTDIPDLIVGTFYTTNGNTLKCRDSVAIGAVTAGAERTFSGLSITVEAGDYIGCYYTGDGRMERHPSGFAGYWYVSGEFIDPNDETDYILSAGDAISFYGYGDIVGVPANTVYLVKATGKRTQLAAGAVAIRVDPATGRRSLDTSLTKFLVREDDGTLRAKSA